MICLLGMRMHLEGKICGYVELKILRGCQLRVSYQSRVF